MFYKVHSEILKFNFPSMIEVTMQSEKYAAPPPPPPPPKKKTKKKRKKKPPPPPPPAPPKKTIQNTFHYQQTEKIFHIYSVQSDMIQWGVYENHSNITEKGRFEQHALNY